MPNLTKEDDPTISIETGSDDHPTNQHQASNRKKEPDGTASTNSSGGVRVAKILTALAVFGMVIFVVAFSMARARDDKAVAEPPMDETPTASPVANETTPTRFTSTNDPFPVSLALFNNDITHGYEDDKELETDLENAAKFLLNNVMKRNTNYERFEGDNDMMVGAPEAVTDDSSSTGSVGDDVSDYGQNNQEDGVEEGDMMVSNGEIVFAAFGSKIVMWTATSGESLDGIEMPEINVTYETVPPTDADKPRPVDEPVVLEPRSSIIGPGGGYGYNRKPWIRHLLLDGDRLMVVVEGYGAEFRQAMMENGNQTPVLSDYMATNIRMYQVNDGDSDSGPLTFLSEKHVNGRFMDVRSIDGNAHVVTHTGIDTYSNLVAPFEKYRFPDMSEEEYIAYVTTAAAEKAIPEFTSRILEELKEPTGEMPNFFRLALMQSDVSDSGLEEIVFSDGVVNSVAQVYSFDMSSDLSTLEVSASGSFFSSWHTRVYASLSTMILAGDGWEYDAKTGSSKQTTHLLGISLDGSSSSPASIGSVEGSFLNEHSLDVVGNVLRIATTVRDNNWIFMPIIMEDEEPVDADNTVSDSEGREPAFAEENNESNTENYIIAVDLSAPDGVMEELDRIQLGKPNEVFTAVRFFDNVAYAVTFEQRDPLYVLDLSDPTNLIAVSELDITGFSNYLHSLNPPDNDILLAIGQEADETGDIIGFQITVFDMRDRENPVVVQRLVVENEENSYSGSAAEWDFMATRVVAGRLILPLDINNWEDQSKSFHGFVVYVVNENLIEEECRVSHSYSFSSPIETPEGEAATEVCYYCGASLPQRSMIFNGDLMTTQGAMVKATDMGNCVEVWELDVTEGNDDEMCCYTMW